MHEKQKRTEPFNKLLYLIEKYCLSPQTNCDQVIDDQMEVGDHLQAVEGMIDHLRPLQTRDWGISTGTLLSVD